MKATPEEIREAIEFAERYLIFKSNRRLNLTNKGYFPTERKKGESFVNFCLRVRTMFGPDHRLPRLRVRKR